MAGRKFLAELPEFHIAPTSMRMASLVDALAVAKRFIPNLGSKEGPIEYYSMSILVDDWQAFMHAFDEELVAGLTTFYDVNVPYEHHRRGGQIRIKINRPQLNILGGTTPSDLLEFMPQRAWGGGFTSRTIFVYSDDRFVNDDFAHVKRALPEDMVHDLKLIYSLEGECNVDEGFRKAVSEWRARNEEPKPSHPKLLHYNTRRRAHVYKLSIISAIDRGPNLRLLAEDFRRALLWLEEAEVNMQTIFTEGASHIDMQVQDEVIDWLRRQGKPIPEHRLTHEIAKRVPAHAVLKVKDIMWLSGRLEMDEKTRLYRAKDQ